MRSPASNQRLVYKWALVLGLVAGGLGGLSVASAGHTYRGYFNYATSVRCTWITTLTDHAPNYVMSATTSSYAGNCLGMTSPNPPITLSDRAAGQIGARFNIWKNSALCTTSVNWGVNPGTQATAFKTLAFSSGSIPCGAGGAFQTQAFGRVATGGLYYPSGEGSPALKSGAATW